jgi:hypothetical protein
VCRTWAPGRTTATARGRSSKAPARGRPDGRGARACRTLASERKDEASKARSGKERTYAASKCAHGGFARRSFLCVIGSSISTESSQCNRSGAELDRSTRPLKIRGREGAGRGANTDARTHALVVTRLRAANFAPALTDLIGSFRTCYYYMPYLSLTVSYRSMGQGIQ